MGPYLRKRALVHMSVATALASSNATLTLYLRYLRRQMTRRAPPPMHGWAGTATSRAGARQSRCNVLEFIPTVLLLELTPGPNMAYLATPTLDRG
jgi:hypothetical protein